jgi:lipopolysaccharide assembly outer membrane protein LptD (OstA)
LSAKKSATVKERKNRIPTGGCLQKRLFSSEGKKFLLLICALLLLASSFTFADDDQTVISIDSAQKTEYKKDPVTGDDTIVLSGAVSVSVTKGGTKTVITADKVNYDRKTEMLYASGSVTLKSSGSGSSGGQDVTANSLLFNTSTLEGVFDNGRAVQTQSDAINLPSGSTLIVASNIFGRDSSSTIAFKNGVLTFCDNPNPHWKISASRIWLLPGGEFAFFNAVLYVGHIPLAYFPAFYYPKDELVFNPVFGYNERIGYYVQTTTYVYGRKPLDTTSTSTSSSTSSDDDVSKGLFNFMKATKLKEQVREGLVLHNLDDDYTGNTTNYFKIMGDYYSNLGEMVGLEGVAKPNNYITDIEATVKLGFTNTIFYNDSVYMPYSPSGLIYTDKSNFMGLELPFRYSANFKITVSKPFSLTLSLPIYSDPYFTYDFGSTRTESMDWIGFLMSGAKTTKDDDTDTASEVSSFTWALNGSYSVDIPTVLKPFISTLSISSFSSQIVFSSMSRTFTTSEKTDDWYTYTPERKFYYPSQITPFKIAGKLAGTLIQIPAQTTTTTKTTNTEPQFPLPLVAPDDMKEPDTKTNADDASTADASETAAGTTASTDAVADASVISESDLPDLDTTASSTITEVKGIAYSLDYSIAPEYTSQITYNASNFKTPEDFDWSTLQSSYFQVKVPTTLTSSLGYRDTFLTMSNVFTFSPVYQEHPKLDGYTETSAASLKKTDYEARKLDLANTNAISFRPFLYNSLLKNTGLNWNTTVKMIRTNFIGDAANPEWEYLTTDLTDEECVTVHTLSATLGATEDDYSQTLTLSTTLPPQVDEYSATLAFVFPFVTLNFAGGVKQTSSTDSTWVKEPFQQSSAVSLFSKTLTFTQSFNYNLEDDYADSLKLSLAWKNIQLAYTMQYTYGYDFYDTEEAAEAAGKDIGWNVRTNKEFLPVSVSLAYTTTSKTYHYWKNRITWAPTLNTSIVYDSLRMTNSYFKFIPAITFKINDFLDLTFSSESKNSIIFRYIQSFIGYEDLVGGETNPFIDLYDSFAFWDESLRKASGFKLQNLKMTVTHNLCDWDFSASFTVKPRLLTTNGIKSYDFSPYFTIAVIWKPLSSMKTEILDDYGDWQLNP